MLLGVEPGAALGTALVESLGAVVGVPLGDALAVKLGDVARLQRKPAASGCSQV